jgi:hypothetical protein
MTTVNKSALFEIWRAANPHSPFLQASSEVHAALSAAIAIGRSLLPDEKFTTANAIDIARLILDTSIEDQPAAPSPYGGVT